MSASSRAARAARKLLLTTVVALTLTGCVPSKADQVRIAHGCDGPEGSCAKYVQMIDAEEAPLEGSRVLVPFSGPIRIGDNPPQLAAVTVATNVESRQDEFRMVAVTALRVEPATPQQLIIEFAGMLADGAGIDIPDGVVLNRSGKSVGPLTIKMKTPHSPLAVGLAGVIWEPEERELFNTKNLQKPRNDQREAPVRAELEARFRLRPGMTDDQVAAVLGQYDGADLKRKVPDHRLRAGLLMLKGTSADAAIDFIASDTNRRNVPFEPLQVKSLSEYGAFAAVFYHPVTGKMTMIVDEDMAKESLENIAVVISHETLHSGLGGGSATEETIAMASNTRVYQELMLWDPAIVRSPTPFTRQSNQLVLAIRNSGRYNYPYAGILPRPGVDDALRGVGQQPVRSFRDFLFKPDFYGDIAKTGSLGSEIVERYYQRIAGVSESPGKLKFDTQTLRLFDRALDHGFTPEQIFGIADALHLKPVVTAQK